MGLDALVCFKGIGGVWGAGCSAGCFGCVSLVLLVGVAIAVGGLRIYGAIRLLFVVVSPGFTIGLWLF